MICSRLIDLLYAASGLSVEWLWFFSLIFANSSNEVPPYLWPYSMPIWAKTPGIVSVPIRPSTGATAPNRPLGFHSAPSGALSWPPSSPAPASFSTPTAKPMSTSPAFTAMMAVRNAVAPVAHALATLYTGIPVCPTCFCNCWPMPPRPIRLPAANTPMSPIETPASPSAPLIASAPRSTTSLSKCLPNLVMWIPRIQMSSLALIALFLSTLSGDSSAWVSAGRFESEVDRIDAMIVRAGREGREPQLHAQRHVLGIRRAVDDVAADAGAVAVDNTGDERHFDTWSRKRDDRERTQLALRRDRHRLEVVGEATGAGIAPIEEPGPATGALVSNEMRIAVVQHEVVDKRNLSPGRHGVDPSAAASSM